MSFGHSTKLKIPKIKHCQKLPYICIIILNATILLDMLKHFYKYSKFAGPVQRKGQNRIKVFVLLDGIWLTKVKKDQIACLVPYCSYQEAYQNQHLHLHIHLR